jgi:hypothetical protein
MCSFLDLQIILLPCAYLAFQGISQYRKKM